MTITVNQWGKCSACKMEVRTVKSPSGPVFTDLLEVEVIEKAGQPWYGLAERLIYWPMPATLRLVMADGAVVEAKAGMKGYRKHSDTCGLPFREEDDRVETL